MPSTFTLDDIRSAAEEKYGATKIDLGDQVVELRNVIRLSKDERAALKAYQEEDSKDDEDDEELFDRLSRLVRIVAGSQEQASALLSALGGDRLDLLAEIVRKYIEDQKSGKASE